MQSQSNHYSFITNEEIINQLQSIFVFHPLVKSDLLRKNTHPKLGFYHDHIFFAFHVPTYNIESGMYENIEVDLIVTNTHLFVGTSQSIERINTIVKENSAKHPFEVLYLILHSLYNHIFDILDDIDDVMVQIHDELFIHKNIRGSIIEKLYVKKSDLILFKHNIEPQDELLEKMIKEGQEQFPEIICDLKLHLDELQSTLTKVTGRINNLIENISALAESYNQLLGIRSNKIMTSLTVVSAIFIPFTFITGVFGMNFSNIPFTKDETGFYGLMGIMVCIVIIILWTCKRQGLFEN